MTAEPALNPRRGKAELLVGGNVMRPDNLMDAMLRHVASWGDRFPMASKKSRSLLCVKQVRPGSFMRFLLARRLR
jgi:hypothetical protein